MASFASSATTGGARKHAWTNNIFSLKNYLQFCLVVTRNLCFVVVQAWITGGDLTVDCPGLVGDWTVFSLAIWSMMM